MNRKAFLFQIFLIVILIIALMGGFFYYQLKTHGLKIITGNVVIDIKYNSTRPQNNETNQTERNISATNITITEINTSG